MEAQRRPGSDRPLDAGCFSRKRVIEERSGLMAVSDESAA